MADHSDWHWFVGFFGVLFFASHAVTWHRRAKAMDDSHGYPVTRVNSRGQAYERLVGR